MRCVDVIRELAAPSEGPEAAGVADHVARCPRCAAWSKRDARLNRLWEATAPPDLATDAWERIWASVSESFDRASAPVPMTLAMPPASPSSRPWRRGGARVFVFAQAAAILAAVVLLPRFDPRQRPAPRASAPPAIATAALEIEKWDLEQSQVPVIKLGEPDRGARKIRDLAQNENGVDDAFFAFYNKLEANAAVQ